MSKSKKISFVVPDYIYDGLASLPILCGDLTVHDLFKACAINRMIERGFLDEFGCPVVFPKFDITGLHFYEFDKNSLSFNLDNLREVSKND